MLNLLAQDSSSLVMIIVLMVAIVGLFIWSSYSNKKKQKQAQDMVNGIQIGDKVKTIGGVCGYVAEINDSENTFVLKTGLDGKENCFVKFDKGAIYQTAPAKPRTEKKEEEPKTSTAEKPKAKRATKKVAEKPAEQPVEEVKAEETAE